MPNKHEELYDPFRQGVFSAEPEERVRQALLKHMVEKLGFPKSLLVVEKALSLVPHLKHVENLPHRRLDILAYGRHEGELFPLLLVECKAEPLTDRVINQVLGYNCYIQAPFLAVANSEEMKTLWMDEENEEWQSKNGLPSYQQLLSALEL